jgi:hypothetical protein
MLTQASGSTPSHKRLKSTAGEPTPRWVTPGSERELDMTPRTLDWWPRVIAEQSASVGPKWRTDAITATVPARVTSGSRTPTAAGESVALPVVMSLSGPSKEPGPRAS